MRKIKFQFGIGFVGAEHRTTEEFEDDVTDEEIEEFLKEFIWEHIDACWEDME